MKKRESPRETSQGRDVAHEPEGRESSPEDPHGCGGTLQPPRVVAEPAPESFQVPPGLREEGTEVGAELPGDSGEGREELPADVLDRALLDLAHEALDVGGGVPAHLFPHPLGRTSHVPEPAIHVGKLLDELGNLRGVEVLQRGAEESEGCLALGHWVLHRLQPADDLGEGLRALIPSSEEVLGHLLLAEAQRLVGAPGRGAHIRRSDRELLDRVARFVDAKHALLGGVRQEGHRSLTRDAERFHERAILVHRIHDVLADGHGNLLEACGQEVKALLRVGGEPRGDHLADDLRGPGDVYLKAVREA